MRTKTGIEGLDIMLNGGLLSGRVILLSGSAGTGKSTLGMQFIYNGIKQFNEPGVFITLEQDKEKLKQDMKSISMDLDKLGNSFSLIGGSMAKIKYYQTKTKAKLEDFIAEIEEVVKETKSERIVIDSINLLLLLFNTDEERRKALLALTEALSRLKCTALLTCEVRENTFDISWWGFEQFVVDGVIAMYNVKKDPMFYQGIVIRKMRGMDHNKNIVPYKITDKGIAVYPEEPWLGGETKIEK
ncbi:MAG: AAA family ATPase [Candidatus Aenigmarchaeota archaeon]|nr:AAA family ATPase [Candidatus Aenigmarchaeota archaeon]